MSRESTVQENSDYRFDGAKANCTSRYVWPALEQELATLKLGAGTRVFDLGCGNGALAAHLHALGFDVSGVDPSHCGIQNAARHHPELHLSLGSCYDDLAAQYGRFPVVVSLEVVEHVFDPSHFAVTLFDLVGPGGTAFVSTPYHGYLKNVALAVTGKLDSHFTALWDGGHIKFFSIKTLGTLLTEAGFRDVRFRRIGRVPALAKSMLAIARRPLE
jgi:2-polyprenyl-3-methyl-5-hydroxy-6-metoxy-1,4-benzoquinol methylase